MDLTWLTYICNALFKTLDVRAWSFLLKHDLTSLHLFQTATGDNSEAYSTLERILNTATAVGDAFKDKENAKDTELIFNVSELLRLAYNFSHINNLT